jgi:hypothetical protein
VDKGGFDLQTLMTQFGKTEFLPLDLLHINRSYQPEFRQRPAVIRPMAADWMPPLVMSLLVSYRRGKHWVVDGATRLEGARLRNSWVQDGTKPFWTVIPGLPCTVHDNLTLADEAQLFERLNTKRVAVHQVDKYKARLQYEDPAALAVRDALALYEIEVNYVTTSASISAIQTLEHLHIWSLLHQTLEVIETAWPQSEIAHQRPILLGVGAFLRVYGDAVPLDDLISLLRDRSPKRLNEEATASQILPNTYSIRSSWARVAALIQQGINEALGRDSRSLWLPAFRQPKLPSRAVLQHREAAS